MSSESVKCHFIETSIKVGKMLHNYQRKTCFSIIQLRKDLYSISGADQHEISTVEATFLTDYN